MIFFRPSFRKPREARLSGIHPLAIALIVSLDSGFAPPIAGLPEIGVQILVQVGYSRLGWRPRNDANPQNSTTIPSFAVSCGTRAA